ncbi:TPA: hydrogenase maturation factor HybG [Proteus mirabilis]|uniref:hydrogenase maturation factor HybG n=1 Tax=Proteus TaxID=583 RepID=UPI0006664F59|nr:MULTISPECIES: hydrogenase maturation factor HybG [Proteus]EGT3590322.1 hydrogenase maturation factor HybG [Proteus mirabilis]ELL8905632.1 hydrogenase maturation factor HybG [Proteus mirabilis]EMA4722157.1 hydrogenase maturation factor HybG [Proteus mirabilis]KAB7721176.1 hydrogenase maturation factor HybG [Proteus mirabilis]MBF8453345.1 hydrogenase maturation factor HybG [Proteus mirabilis]
MCLGVPAKIVEVGDDIHQLAYAEVSGVKRAVNISMVCEGDPSELLDKWVLIHVGFAMSILDEQEAQDTLDALQHVYGVTLEEADDAIR